jgi:hypothetical protein
MAPPTAHPRPDGPLDRTTLTAATAASLLVALGTSALGGGFLASLIAAAVAPAITAFVVHPGSYRRNRRIGAVAALILLLRGGREALAHERTSAERDVVAPAFNAALAFVIAAVWLTLLELMLGQAAIADRRLTLLPDRSGTAVAVAEERPIARPSGGDTRGAVERRHERAPASRRPAPTPTATPAPHARDRVAPDLWLPPGVTAPARDDRGTTVAYRARAVDSRDGVVAVECVPASGSRFAVGRTTVRCTTSDRAGNEARGSFPVVVHGPADTAPPRLRMPAGVARATDDPNGLVVRFEARAVDGRDGPVAVTCAPRSGTRFPVGTTIVRCTARDAAGNAADGGFSVVVRARDHDDVTPPSPGDPVPEPEPKPDPVPDPAPDPVPDPRPEPAIDRERPALQLPPDMLVETRDDAGTPVQYAASAVDDRDGPVPVSCVPASGATFPVRRTTVRCTAADRAGNVAAGRFVVEVVYVG